jgi:hypothetical protein
MQSTKLIQMLGELREIKNIAIMLGENKLQ